MNSFQRDCQIERLFVGIILCLVLSAAAFGQAEKLGIVKYTPVKGWTKTSKENVVAFSTIDAASGRFCIITLYGATPGTGGAQGDFVREWKNLVVDTLGAAAGPKTETITEDGWTATAGGSAVQFQSSDAAAFLTVLSGGGKTVSVLAVFNDPKFMDTISAFIAGMDTDSAAPAADPPRIENGKVVIPFPSRQLTVADLVGEWGETAGFTQTYVDRYSGTYAGTDSLHYRSKMTFTQNGGYLNDFFAIRNGQKIIDKTSGTVTIVRRVLSIREKNTAKYVIRGWLELPDMTVLKVCGPWYDDDAIPEAIFSNPNQGANLDKNWVRKK